MSSDEVKVKFVADTTGLENVPLPTPKPKPVPPSPTPPSPTPPGPTPPGPTPPGPTPPGPTPPGPRPPTPPPIPPGPPPLPTPPSPGGGGRGRGRKALPWESGWADEAKFDITSGLADALSGINLISTAWSAATKAAEMYVDAIKGGIEYAQKIEKVSRISGLTVEEVQKYGYAAQMSGVDFETFAGAMANANKELGKLALYGGTSVVALSRLGINVDNVKNHSVGAIEVLKKMADAYKKHAETAEMAALGNQLFGGSFKDMIPMLRNGSAEIERLAEQAPKVDAQTISASAAAGRSFTGIKETAYAKAAEDLVGYTRSEEYTAKGLSKGVESGDVSAKDAVEKLLKPANRGAEKTLLSSGARLGEYAQFINPATAYNLGVKKLLGIDESNIAAKATAGEGIRGAGEDTKTVRERFIAMRGGKLENLNESDKKIVAAFDDKIKEEGKMNLQSGTFQAASKMQQMGGGDVLSAISRVDFAQQTADNTARTAAAVEKIANNQPGGSTNTPPPPDTNGPVAK
jgi:hypothetical protein